MFWGGGARKEKKLPNGNQTHIHNTSFFAPHPHHPPPPQLPFGFYRKEVGSCRVLGAGFAKCEKPETAKTVSPKLRGKSARLTLLCFIVTTQENSKITRKITRCSRSDAYLPASQVVVESPGTLVPWYPGTPVPSSSCRVPVLKGKQAQFPCTVFTHCSPPSLPHEI